MTAAKHRRDRSRSHPDAALRDAYQRLVADVRAVLATLNPWTGATLEDTAERLGAALAPHLAATVDDHEPAYALPGILQRAGGERSC